MKKPHIWTDVKSAWGTLVLLLSAVIATSLLGYLYKGEAATVRRHIETITTQTSQINNLENENAVLKEALYSEQKKNDDFESQIEEIASTVGLLDKLSKTDPELLQKYSKVYFLNEHYEPTRLVRISGELAYPKNKELYIHREVSPFLLDMIGAAKDDGIDMNIVSAYRSFGTQADLKSSYKFTYGAGTANQFSADQGYSEHQLGTTVDLTTPETGGAFNSFENTDAFKWLQKNAHKYGFVLSYPKGNGYYQYEPWHWRFVGRDLAEKLHDDSISFYEMDQRTIDSYLVKIFD